MRELWFIVVMAAVALLLLAVILGAVLHKVRKQKTAWSRLNLFRRTNSAGSVLCAAGPD